MIAWLRRILTPDTAHLEARLRDAQADRDYWRRIAEQLLDEALAQRSAAPGVPVFDRLTTSPSTIAGTPFAELFAAMASDRVTSTRDRTGGSA